MRVAIYFTPDRDHPLTRRAAEWLGRDAFDDRATRPPDASIDPYVSGPARYGFHATLKAPFRLAPGRSIDELHAELTRYSPSRDDIAVGRLRIRRIEGFFALTAQYPSPQLAGLKDHLCAGFEPFRAPLSEADVVRRRPETLTARQRDNPQRWFYHHTGPDFRFHMTLTNAVADEGEAHSLEQRLHDHFGPVLRKPIVIDALTLFVEPRPGEHFQVHSTHPLRAPIPIGVFAP